MKSGHSTFSSACATASLIALLSLYGCGGGGSGSETTSDAPQVPAIPVLQSSGGDLGKYANTVWVSDCGLLLMVGNGSSTYQRNTFRFAVPVGTTVPGSISTTQYSASSCTGIPLTGSGTVVPVNFHYVRQLTVTSGTPATAQGTADELLITEVASGASQTFTVGFLPDFLKFAGGTSSFFNAASLRYNKL
jgi:hypothetical protein